MNPHDNLSSLKRRVGVVFAAMALMIIFSLATAGSPAVASAAPITSATTSFVSGFTAANGIFSVLQNGHVGIGTSPDTIMKITAPGTFLRDQSNENVQVLINGADPVTWYSSWHPGAGVQPVSGAAAAITGAITVPSSATVHESAGIAGYVKSQKSSAWGSDVGGFFQAEAAANGTSVLGIDSECVVGAGLTSAICQNLLRTRIHSPGVTAVGLNVVLDGKVSPSTSYGLAVQASNASTKWGWGFVSTPGAATIGIELQGVSTGNSVDSQPIKLTGKNASGAFKSATLYANKDGELFIQPQSLTSFSGRMGVGTDIPAAPLHVIGNNGTGAIAAFQINPTSSYVVLGNGLGKAVVQGVSAKGKEDTLVLNPQGVGQVGIGTTAPTAQLHTTGTVRFSKFGAGTLTTDASGNLLVSSDERLKTIDGAFTRGFADIMKLAPISYHWNSLSGLDQTMQYAGFSAQNVRQAIPEAVGSSVSGYLTLQDRPLIAALVNAVKELGTKITALFVSDAAQNAEIEQLKERVRELENRQGIQHIESEQVQS